MARRQGNADLQVGTAARSAAKSPAPALPPTAIKRARKEVAVGAADLERGRVVQADVFFREWDADLASRRDPLPVSLLAAPEEDEELDAEEQHAVEQGLADHKAGRVFSSERVKLELGV